MKETIIELLKRMAIFLVAVLTILSYNRTSFILGLSILIVSFTLFILAKLSRFTNIDTYFILTTTVLYLYYFIYHA